MNKLDFRNNLRTIIEVLKTDEIISMLTQEQPIEGAKLQQLIIESKSGYDKASIIESNKKIFDEFGAMTFYNTANFSQLMTYCGTVGTQQKHIFFSNPIINTFYSFHNSLRIVFNIVDKLLIENSNLFNEQRYFNFDEAENKGLLTLQIVSEDKISLQKIKVIFEAIDELLKTIYQLFDKIENEKFEEIPLLDLIDSGSDINFIIKIPKKAANQLSQILREAFEFIFNKKTYQLKQNNKALRDSLTVIKKIEEARKKKTIDDVTSEVLKKSIVENTLIAINSNTVSKNLLLGTSEISNRTILIQMNKQYLLDEHNEASEKE